MSNLQIMQAVADDVRAGIEAFNKEMEARGSKIRAAHPMEIQFRNWKPGASKKEKPWTSIYFWASGELRRPDQWLTVID